MSEKKEKVVPLEGEIKQEEAANNTDNIDADWNDYLSEQNDFDRLTPTMLNKMEGESKQTKTADDVKLGVILDVPVTVSMEIGRTQINIRDLLQLNQGSVIELDRLVGEPMDVLVNGTLIAHGEVVVVNDKFGIRLTDVISPSDRAKQLG